MTSSLCICSAVALAEVPGNANDACNAHAVMCVNYVAKADMLLYSASVYCFPSYCLLTPLMSPKDKKYKLIDSLIDFFRASETEQ